MPENIQGGFDILPKEKEWEPTPTQKKSHPYGNETPYAWILELVHGCNLNCGHCSCRLDPPGQYTFMSLATWKASWEIIAEVSPTVRVDICLGGEPTLHKHIYKFLRIARKISPLSQIQITTNGTQLKSGRLTYAKLFEAGVNIVYTDMYGPTELFTKLAEESGIPWYEYYKKPKTAPSPWSYHGPELQVIVLQEQPENWPKSRFRAGLMGTWYNNLDWEAAKRFGLTPVTTPPKRRCNQPFIYVPVHASGKYLLCCQDNVGESKELFGTVHEGVDGFKKYWYGKEIQTIRRRLRNKNRLDTTFCSRCCITFSRCDYIHWKENELNTYWNGEKEVPMPSREETEPKWLAQEKEEAEKAEIK